MSNNEVNLPWIIEAYQYLDNKEIPEVNHSGIILGWLKELKAWWHNDEPTWCGGFIAHCMISSGFKIPKLWMTAKDWTNFGIDLEEPQYGCIVIFNRQEHGHVGFVVGETDDDYLVVLGGNQKNNSVSLAKFSKYRVLAYVMPEGNYAFKHLPKMTVSES